MASPDPLVDPLIYQILVEQVQDYALFVLDPAGRIMTWNVGARRIKGYAPEEIIGKHFSAFYTPDAVERGWPAEELRLATREGRFEDEGWRLRKDGSRFWANVIITALRDEHGKLLGFSKITRDLSERRAQEQLLRRSEENIRLLIEGVKDHAIFLVDPDGAVRNWNAGGERVLGYRSQDIVGRNASCSSLRSLRSRVILEKPRSFPSSPRSAVITTLAQKREPPLRTRQPSSSKRPSRVASRSSSAGQPRATASAV